MRPVLDRRSGGDEHEIELPLQSFADDLHVQQTEEPATKTETQRPDVSGS